MKYKAVVFDVDGTLVEPVSSWRYIHERLGLWDALAERYQEQFLAGEIDYRTFCLLDAAHWKGIPDARMRELFKEVPYTGDARKVVAGLRKLGLSLIALSTGLQYIPERLADELGFDRIVSNRLEVNEGVLTGDVEIAIAHDGKAGVLVGLLAELGISPGEAIAVGDGAGDVPVARLCGYSIAFDPKDDELARIADHVCRSGDLHDVLDHILALMV